MYWRGNCYATSEALYHLLGGKRAGWKPMHLNTKLTGPHWFLKHKSGLILDATAKQFPRNVKVDYSKAVGCGFLTKKPSQLGQQMMSTMLWKGEI